MSANTKPPASGSERGVRGPTKMGEALRIARDLFIGGSTQSLIQAIKLAAVETGIDAAEVRDVVKAAIRNSDGDRWRHNAIKRAAEECRPAAPPHTATPG
jgi:3-hydroxyisobutyrate dehydrogenase-like beta-hydroxyacid dehydrogenase